MNHLYYLLILFREKWFGGINQSLVVYTFKLRTHAAKIN